MKTLLDVGDIANPFLDAALGDEFDGLHADELTDEMPWLTFADWIQSVAGVVQSKGTPAALWLAAEVQQLADLARAINAATPAEFDARRAVLDEQRDNELRDQGYDCGLHILGGFEGRWPY